ncbi:HET-domain-containing protein, partial [Lophiostoma macrostomum CBS 122681]
MLGLPRKWRRPTSRLTGSEVVPVVQVRHNDYHEIPPNTAAPEIGRLARSWLRKCIEEHPNCDPLRPSRRCPPRLLDISDETSRPRLVLTASEYPPSTPYVALSHCWGLERFLTLDVFSLDKFTTEGIDYDDLPQNFRDAIRICRMLDIKYLWIDSLCILQSGLGSAEDWLHHVKIMGSIYQNSILCISTAEATQANDGSVIVVPNSLHGYWNSRLASRGWVLQERMLSPRVLTFASGQVYWHCTATEYHNVCETFPSGVPFELPRSGPLTIPHAHSQTLAVKDRDRWAEIRGTYSRCALTRADLDKFAAFSAIAERFSHACGDDEYVAGFFKHELPATLTWSITPEHR